MAIFLLILNLGWAECMETHMNYGDYFRTPVYVWFVTVSNVLILLIRWFFVLACNDLHFIRSTFGAFQRTEREAWMQSAVNNALLYHGDCDAAWLQAALVQSIPLNFPLGWGGWYVLLSVYVTLNCHNKKRLDKIVFVTLVRILLARCCLNMYFARDSWYKHKTTFGLCGKFRSLKVIAGLCTKISLRINQLTLSSEFVQQTTGSFIKESIISIHRGLITQ